ncbi:MAG: NUDIX hydrolase [Terriglobia bacterium]
MNREFPRHPILCVGGVVVKRGSVLLIRRGQEPHKGEWSFPGGMVELGEKVEAAVRREIWEETGLRVRPLELLMVFERIVRKNKKVRFHYAVLDFRCRDEGGKLRPASDVTDARWVRRDGLRSYSLNPAVLRVIAQAFERSRRAKAPLLRLKEDRAQRRRNP